MIIVIAEIICVGTELLMGQVINTNANYASRVLAPVGIDLYHEQVVGDNPARLKDAIRLGLSRADTLILVGGLGPTDDDLTKETACSLLGQELVLWQDIWDDLVAHFARRGKKVSSNNRKQAMFPKDCIILKNPNGTAPGCLIEKDGKRVAMLPGPPREFEPMFLNELLPRLTTLADHRLYSRVVRIFGMGESEVTTKLDRLIKQQTNPTIAPYVKTGETTLRVTARCSSDEEGEALVRPMVDEIVEILGDVVFSTCDEELNALCHRRLTELGLSLCVAESITGGLLASAFVDLPGASAYFAGGIVSYSNEQKHKLLNVEQSVLDSVGAVSRECAKQMAEGARRLMGTDLALATTGYAGPGGENVGLVYVAIADKNGTEVKELHLMRDRARIRRVTVLNALDILRRRLG